MSNINDQEKSRVGDAIAHELMELPEIIRQIPAGATLHIQLRWNDDDLKTNLPWAICMGFVYADDVWPDHLTKPKGKNGDIQHG